MNIFCNSEGVIIGTTPEKIFQGSAGVNKIYFVGQFPSSAQVLMSYTLPNGISTSPKMLSHVDTLEQVRGIDGGIFSVWETRIGAVPRINDGEIVTDDNGNVVYDLDYTITEHHGKATIQFFVYDAAQTASVDGVTESIYGGRLATEKVVFDILEGVPTILPNSFDEEGDVSTILNRILWNLASTKSAYNNVKDDVGTLTEEVETIKTDVNDIKDTTNDIKDNTIPVLRTQLGSRIETVAEDARNYYATDMSAEMDDTDYKLHIALKNSKGVAIGQGVTIDLPLEELVVSGAYDDNTSSIVLTLKNGQTISFKVDEIVRGFVPSASVGQPYGVAKLGEDGKILPYQLPDDIGSGGGIDEEALAEYVKFTDYATADKAGVIKTKDEFGANMSGDTLYLVPAYDVEITSQSSATYRALMPRHISKIVKVGVTTNTETWTDEEKKAACKTIGAIAKPTSTGLIRYSSADGSSSTYGVYQSSPAAQQVPLAKTGGRITTNTPEDDLDCVNKKYADETYLAKKKGVTSEVIITQKPDGTTGNLAYTTDIANLHIVRRTINGDVLVPDMPVSPYGAVNKNFVENAVANAGSGGGGTKLYKHTINTTIPDTYYNIQIVIVSTTAAAYTSRSDISNDIKNANVFTVGQNYLQGAMSVLSNTLELYAFSSGSYTRIMDMPNEFTDEVTEV